MSNNELGDTIHIGFRIDGVASWIYFEESKPPVETQSVVIAPPLCRRNPMAFNIHGDIII